MTLKTPLLCQLSYNTLLIFTTLFSLQFYLYISGLSLWVCVFIPWFRYTLYVITFLHSLRVIMNTPAAPDAFSTPPLSLPFHFFLHTQCKTTFILSCVPACSLSLPGEHKHGEVYAVG